MNTQMQVHSLQAGEALPVLSRTGGQAILVKGEVLVQAPARLLAGMVLLSPPTRLSAPAQLRLQDGSSVLAVHQATIVVEEAPSLVAMLRSMVARGRRALSLQVPQKVW
jgi:molybdopterin-binding protein